MKNTHQVVLQTFIIPVCRRDAKSGNIDYLLGTAFFTAIPGVFITAGHVYKEVLAQTQKEAQYGLCVKGKNNENLFTPIKKENVEFAPNGLDIAIGRVEFTSKSPIKFSREPLTFMQDVAAYGYPWVTSELENNPNRACWMDMRGNKGHINRETCTKAKELVGRHTEADLSFRLESGMSGAPLFVSNQFLVGGVCIGTKTSEQYEYRIDEQDKVLRHLEYGVACMISTFSSWKPLLLNSSEYTQLF